MYNLEGVEAVVAAAEEEQSPAILQVRRIQLLKIKLAVNKSRTIFFDLYKFTEIGRFFQIHPSAFKHGGVPLVACCISAAEQASVSIYYAILFSNNNLPFCTSTITKTRMCISKEIK